MPCEDVGSADNQGRKRGLTLPGREDEITPQSRGLGVADVCACWRLSGTQSVS